MIYLTLFWTFFKIGLFTFGGGYAMIPLIQSEVIGHGWMTQEAIVNFIAVSESTPGPFAVNISTYVGAVTGGFGGACCATVGVVLPSFLIILAVAKFFSSFQCNRLVKGAMNGLRPAVIGLIGSAAVSVGQTVFLPSGGVESLFSYATGVSLIVFLLALLAVWKKLHPIIIIAVSAVLGIAGGLLGEATGCSLLP